ncbi:hypothetical protein ACFPM0_17250 [Pseudonocardia sulfidoxydans]|uniref:hypothetical protein n=1 Tax=Pseudonocardia sulfidoxydans TaxID=54011 RepID=UPI003622E62B
MDFSFNLASTGDVPAVRHSTSARRAEPGTPRSPAPRSPTMGTARVHGDGRSGRRRRTQGNSVHRLVSHPTPHLL